MREVLRDIERWRSEGKAVALATVVKVYGSAPRPLGAKMAISEKGEMAGSVSGGCVEGAVVQEALAVIKHQQATLIEYGIADELAMSVGLACGGNIQVFVEPLSW
ncbi:MAG: XdhC family protein [Caldilineaceae bacterium]|nr:XdhC family protein [Caldilineaceae bacterium]